MKTTIEYQNNRIMVARMIDVQAETKRELEVIAQKYMQQFQNIESAHIFQGGFETVVSLATEWQKRNG